MRQDKLDEVSERMIAAFADMERSGEGLAMRKEADGTITQGISFESMIAAVRVCGLYYTDDEAIELFQRMDEDGDCVLQLAEFHSYCKDNPGWSAAGVNKRSLSGREITPGGEIVAKIFEQSESGYFRVVEIFFLVDTDGSGELDRNEFEVAIDMMRMKLTAAEIDLAFGELDEDGGGTIEIEEFMARMRREKKWKKEDEEHERELDAREQEARLIEGLTGDAKQIAIENAGNSAWNMAKMRLQLAQWQDEGEPEHEDDDYAAFMQEELEAQIAEAAFAKEDEEARLAEEEHAREEQEALEAEATLAKEEAEAEAALQAAKQEELEAKLAADKAEKEMREAIAAEKKAARERLEANSANAKLEQERKEAVEAQEVVDAKALALEEFIKGPLAEAEQEKIEARADLGLTDSLVDSDWASSTEYSGADKARVQQADIHFNLLMEKKQMLDNELAKSRAVAEKELEEAIAAEREALRESMEADEAEKVAQRERQEAVEAQHAAAKEKAEAVEARRLAQKELDDVAEARETANRERREAEEAKARALKEREEADEAQKVAIKEREEADAAKYKYYSKKALEYGIRWKNKARVMTMARRREDHRLRREMKRAAPPTRSAVQEMLGQVGAECYRWEAEVATAVSTQPEKVANRARELQALRKQYIVALRKEQKRQQMQLGSGKLPRSRQAAINCEVFGTSASSYVSASSSPRGCSPSTPKDSHRVSGSCIGSTTERERGSARRHRAESTWADGGPTGWTVRGAGGTLFSARDSARRTSAQMTSPSDRHSLSKVAHFRSSTRQLVSLPTKTLSSTPRGQPFSPIGRAALPPAPPTPSRELHKISVRDAALLNAFESSRQ